MEIKPLQRPLSNKGKGTENFPFSVAGALTRPHTATPYNRASFRTEIKQKQL